MAVSRFPTAYEWRAGCPKPLGVLPASGADARPYSSDSYSFHSTTWRPQADLNESGGANGGSLSPRDLLTGERPTRTPWSGPSA